MVVSELSQAKEDTCTPAELCRASSVIALVFGEKGVRNFCASDSQCPTYSLQEIRDLDEQHEVPFCCGEVRDFISAQCVSINQTLLQAVTQTVCKEPPSCVPQWPRGSTAGVTTPVATTAAFSPVQAASATTPADVTTAFKVTVSLSLPRPFAAFNASVRQSLREALAAAAGLARGEVGRVQLEARAARRRLLADTVAVDATLNMPNATAAGRAAGMLTAGAINAELGRVGLPSATVTKAAAAVFLSAGSAAGSASLAVILAVMVATTAATAVGPFLPARAQWG
jgi:hypothetical protein